MDFFNYFTREISGISWQRVEMSIVKFSRERPYFLYSIFNEILEKYKKESYSSWSLLARNHVKEIVFMES